MTVAPNQEPLPISLVRALMRPGEGSLPDDAPDMRDEQNDAITAARSHLNGQQLAVIESLYDAHLSVQETAELLLVSPAVVESIHEDALAAMRAALPEGGRRDIVTSPRYQFVPLSDGEPATVLSKQDEAAIYAYFDAHPHSGILAASRAFNVRKGRVNAIKARWDRDHKAPTYEERIEQARRYLSEHPDAKTNYLCREYRLRFSDISRVRDAVPSTVTKREMYRDRAFAYLGDNPHATIRELAAYLGTGSNETARQLILDWKATAATFGDDEASSPAPRSEEETETPVRVTPPAVTDAPTAPIEPPMPRRQPTPYETHYQMCVAYEEVLERQAAALREKLARLHEEQEMARAMTTAAKEMAERFYALQTPS